MIVDDPIHVLPALAATEEAVVQTKTNFALFVYVIAITGSPLLLFRLA